MSIREQAEYVDEVTYYMANSEMFKRRMLRKSPYPFDCWNVTAVGNAAYMALNCKNKKVRDWCKKLLLDYKKWREENDR